MNFDVSQLVSLENRSCWIFLGSLFLVGLVGGWIFYPFTIGAFTRRVRSPWKHFTERCGTAFVAAIAVAFVGFKVAQNFSTPSPGIPAPSSQKVEQEATNDPFGKAAAASAPVVSEEVRELEPAKTEKPSAPPLSQSPAVEAKKPEPIPATPQPSSNPVVKPEQQPPAKPSPDARANKLADLKGELAKVNSQIESERARWTEALNTINQLTNFKKTPVKEGSPAYLRCMAASKVIHEVETGAPALKAEQARLEAVISELDK